MTLSTIEKTAGRYTVRIEREGNAFLYDVLSHGLLVATGFDMLARSVEEVFGKIEQKYGGQTCQ
jgi:hypothetical protein